MLKKKGEGPDTGRQYLYEKHETMTDHLKAEDWHKKGHG